MSLPVLSLLLVFNVTSWKPISRDNRWFVAHINSLSLIDPRLVLGFPHTRYEMCLAAGEKCPPNPRCPNRTSPTTKAQSNFSHVPERVLSWFMSRYLKSGTLGGVGRGIFRSETNFWEGPDLGKHLGYILYACVYVTNAPRTVRPDTPKPGLTRTAVGVPQYHIYFRENKLCLQFHDMI